MKKFQANLELFQKYAGEYGFDYLMIAAQGYQESLLDQGKKNPSGAVGIMQVIPKICGRLSYQHSQREYNRRQHPCRSQDVTQH